MCTKTKEVVVSQLLPSYIVFAHITDPSSHFRYYKRVFKRVLRVLVLLQRNDQSLRCAPHDGGDLVSQGKRMLDLLVLQCPGYQALLTGRKGVPRLLLSYSFPIP